MNESEPKGPVSRGASNKWAKRGLSCAEQFHAMMALEEVPRLLLVVDTLDAIALATLVQLALRHPGVPDHAAKTGRHFIQQVQRGLPPELRKLIEHGFDPRHD